jgi:SAM-dependent methyltransferase
MPTKHPAKFTPAVLERIGWEVQREVSRIVLRSVESHPSTPIRNIRLLDPFAGVGGIHALNYRYGSVEIQTVGVELEPEWASQHPRTIVGDATRLPFPDSSFDLVATSPAYGNRMADSYDGRDGSTRHTYRIDLGRPLTDGNGAGLQWGMRYRELHRSAWSECRRVLKPGGRLILNMSDHYRKDELQPVVNWHIGALGGEGIRLVSYFKVKTPRMRNGANAGKRPAYEVVATLRKSDS